MTPALQGELFGQDTQACLSPLAGRVVCMLGSFAQSNATMQHKLLQQGADYKPSTRVSRNVHYVLVGRGAPQDQLDYLDTLAFNGYHPRVLTQQDWDAIQQGQWESYRTPLQIEKHLRLTMRHFLSARVDYGARMNPLYTHELYIAPDTETPQAEFYQMLGNRGIYANPYIDDTTDVLVISEQTLDHLRKGETDQVLQTIEDTYNASRAQQYRLVMTTERELVGWLRKEEASPLPASPKGEEFLDGRP